MLLEKENGGNGLLGKFKGWIKDRNGSAKIGRTLSQHNRISHA